MEGEVASPGLELAWRAEQALNNAWPSLDDVRAGDWSARFGAGLTRRNNSANPRRADARLGEADILACEAAFDRWGLRRTFRLPSFLAPEIDWTLERAGYGREGETVTLFAPIDRLPDELDARTKVDPVPAPAWLSAKAAFSGLTAAESAIWSKVAARLVVPTGFAGLSEDGALASVAYGAIDDGLLCIEAVVTDPNRRGRGLGRGMLASLIAWGRDLGAMGACLQVQADNSAALALYASLGIGSELYRYHYRRAPAALH